MLSRRASAMRQEPSGIIDGSPKMVMIAIKKPANTVNTVTTITTKSEL